ncbi:hypothetical protein GOP47_0003688 [Adiantum capillus-veneris]|uniref:Uncharacterized protein n=1 Tax=Adiantum capillus-veneris TaxID=13818 RepID=A0A9D4V633_ADICA|nr:hypothetical protein GOP47_0003688 [Adiantum capillus-veneris]
MHLLYIPWPEVQAVAARRRTRLPSDVADATACPLFLPESSRCMQATQRGTFIVDTSSCNLPMLTVLTTSSCLFEFLH